MKKETDLIINNSLIAKFNGAIWYPPQKWYQFKKWSNCFVYENDFGIKREHLRYHEDWKWIINVIIHYMNLTDSLAKPKDNLPDYHKDTDKSWKIWSENRSILNNALLSLDKDKIFIVLIDVINHYYENIK